MNHTSGILRTIITASALTFVPFAANAATANLKADLKGSSEVPSNATAGTGKLTASLDTATNVLKYHVEYIGLTGPAAAAHFHGPAAMGVNAGPQVAVKADPITSPIEGTAVLTPEQEKDLLAGKWYFNIHTPGNPGGEIRGQVVKGE